MGGYNRLIDEDYNHLRVNHSVNFVEPDILMGNNGEIPIHTQTIENYWGEIEEKIEEKEWLGKKT